MNIYFWQRILTPHMTALAQELSKRGSRVIYVAEQSLSKDRIKLGWEVQKNHNIQVVYANDYLTARLIVRNAPLDSIHICQGLRKNGIVTFAQKEIRKKKLRHWVIMETVNDHGIVGIFKRILYRLLILLYQKDIEVILAIGWRTSDWLINLGFQPKKVFPFAYFLSPAQSSFLVKKKKQRPFKFIFIGGLFHGKKLDLLILALSLLKNKNFELVVVGDGPCKQKWKNYAEKLIPNKAKWLGIIKMSKVSKILNTSDCLVLPSKHDGWGAVISESLIVGTPVICSDSCGAAKIVSKSGFGKVFKSGKVNDLLLKLNYFLKLGPLSKKKKIKLSKWSKKITSISGSKYLINIINYANNKKIRPNAPWNL